MKPLQPRLTNFVARYDPSTALEFRQAGEIRTDRGYYPEQEGAGQCINMPPVR